MHVSEEKIYRFVKSKQDWVLSARNKLIETAVPLDNSWQLKNLNEGKLIPFRGEFRFLRVQPWRKNHIAFNCDKMQLNLHLPPHIHKNEHRLIKNALVDWMQQQAAKEVQPLIEKNAQKYNLYPRSCKIKSQKSRWGSCGVRNDIHLNWLLILVPPKVMEYVVIHEICHLQERNHSSRFWALVAKHCPDYKQHRNWLKQYGHSVMQALK